MRNPSRDELDPNHRNLWRFTITATGAVNQLTVFIMFNYSSRDECSYEYEYSYEYSYEYVFVFVQVRTVETASCLKAACIGAKNTVVEFLEKAQHRTETPIDDTTSVLDYFPKLCFYEDNSKTT